MMDESGRGRTGVEVGEKGELENLVVELRALAADLRLKLSSAESLLARAEKKLTGDEGINEALENGTVFESAAPVVAEESIVPEHADPIVADEPVAVEPKVLSQEELEAMYPYRKKERLFREEMRKGPPYRTEEDLLASGLQSKEMVDGFLSWISPDRKWIMFTLNRRSKNRDLGVLSGALFVKHRCTQDDLLADCVVTPAYVYNQDGDFDGCFDNPYTNLARNEKIERGTITKK